MSSTCVWKSVIEERNLVKTLFTPWAGALRPSQNNGISENINLHQIHVYFGFCAALFVHERILVKTTHDIMFVYKLCVWELWKLNNRKQSKWPKHTHYVVCGESHSLYTTWTALELSQDFAFFPPKDILFTSFLDVCFKWPDDIFFFC